MGTFDFGSFKNDFFGKIRDIAQQGGDIRKIDTDTEVQGAKGIQSAFKDELSKINEPIGDAFVKSENKGEFSEVTIADLTALLDDSELNIDRVNQLIAEKPVTTIKSAVTNPIANQMASFVEDADSNKLQAYLDTGYMSGTESHIFDDSDIETVEDFDLAAVTRQAYYVTNDSNMV